MKKIFFTLSLLALFSVSYAQAPNHSDGGVPPNYPPHDYTKKCNGMDYDSRTQKCDCACGIIPITQICTKDPDVKLNCAKSIKVKQILSIGCWVIPPGGDLKVSVGGNLELLSAANDANIRVKGTAIGDGWIVANYTLCNKTVMARCDMDVQDDISVTAPDTITACVGKVRGTVAVGSPDGGTYSWVASNGVSIVGPSNNAIVDFRPDVAGFSKLTVAYSLGTQTAFHTVNIKAMNPVLTLNVPDTIYKAIGDQFSITPTIQPGASTVTWSVSGGLTLLSGPYNYVAFIRVNSNGPEYRTATIRATVCGQVMEKTVVIKVNPCIVNVNIPDSLVVLVGGTGTITATVNTNGNYAWTADGKAEIQGPANQATVTIKGKVAGEGWAEVTFTAKNCSATKRVKVRVLDKPSLTISIAYAPMNTMCKGERRILAATGLPSGGTYTWTLANNSLGFYGPVNGSVAVIEAMRGGNSSVTCTYTVNGQSATVTLNTSVKEYSKIEVTANNNNKELAAGTTVTYTAKAYDQDGNLTATPPLRWRVVYIPVGQDKNVGNWPSNDLQGSGDSQTYTWSFPQGNYPLVGQPPYKMRAWIEAVEYCTYRSGSVHIEVVSQNGRN